MLSLPARGVEWRGRGGGEEGCTEWPHPLRGKGLVLGGKEAGLLEAGLGRHAHEMRIPLLLLGAEGGRRGRTCAAATRIHNTGVNVAGRLFQRRWLAPFSTPLDHAFCISPPD